MFNTSSKHIYLKWPYLLGFFKIYEIKPFGFYLSHILTIIFLVVLISNGNAEKILYR